MNALGSPLPGRSVGPRLRGMLVAAIAVAVAAIAAPHAAAIVEKDGYPWNVPLRSFYDEVMKETLKDGTWYLNLGPTGIRARIYPDRPTVFVVKYVFQDDKSPARGKVAIDDVIVGANGRPFTTAQFFGRKPGAGGWDGPLMELARHIEDSQASKDGVLELMVQPKGGGPPKKVEIKLRKVGRFAPTFPYDCPRSRQMLEELCDFLVLDYTAGYWGKRSNTFDGGIYGKSHQLLALMASGNPKYGPLIQREIAGYAGHTYNPEGGGFQCWNWGFDGIVMGEYYLATKDRSMLPAMQSLAAAMPLGCHAGSGIYSHKSYLNVVRAGGKPYANIAAISGLNMLAMSLFKKAGVPYDKALHQRIHQHYLNSTSPAAVEIAYGFGNKADQFNPPDILPTHAIIVLKDPAKCVSGRGPGYVCPAGMKGIGDYTISWPTKADPRWKPTDWVAAEAATNIVTELGGEFRQVNRNNPRYREMPEPTQPFRTSATGGHLAPVGIGALAHLIGNDTPSWEWLGRHAANTCALGPGNVFDGHAASNLHAFWAILGAARSDQPETRRHFFDYLKTFLILSETHNGGLVLQPWGQDRPGCNSDNAWGPRTLPTATGAILLALGQERLQITGADMKAAASDNAKGKKGKKPPPAKPGPQPDGPHDSPSPAAPPPEPPAPPPGPKLPALPVPPPLKEGEEDSPLDALMRQLNGANGEAPAESPSPE